MGRPDRRLHDGLLRSGNEAHSWQAAGGTSIGKKGMQLADRTMATSAWDLFQQPNTLAAAKAEQTKRLSGRKYAPLLLLGQKPLLDYRNSPTAPCVEVITSPITLSTGMCCHRCSESWEMPCGHHRH